MNQRTVTQTSLNLSLTGHSVGGALQANAY